jgi:hypothetical protein
MIMMDKSVDINLDGVNPTFYFRTAGSLKYEIRALLFFAKSFFTNRPCLLFHTSSNHGSQVKTREVLLVTDDGKKWEQNLRKHL